MSYAMHGTGAIHGYPGSYVIPARPPSAPGRSAARAAWKAVEAIEPKGATGAAEAAGAAGTAETPGAGVAVMRERHAHPRPNEPECPGAAASPRTPRETVGPTPAFASSSTPSPTPLGTPEKIRSKKPNYDSWTADILTQEIVRRRGKDVHVKFGPADDDVETRLSKANRGRLRHILRTWDAWTESKGQAPLWESTTIKTPVKKMSKAAMATLAAAKAASTTGKSTDEASSVGADRMRPGEYPRLIAIVFSDEN